MSYGVDGVTCLDVATGFSVIGDGDPNGYDATRYSAWENQYGLVCFVGLVPNSGPSSVFTLTQDLNLVKSVEGYGEVFWMAYGSVKVPDGVTMTIDPGIQLRFPGGLGLVVETGGTLLTQGTIDERVRLTPLVYPLSEPEIGTWGGVIINDAGPVAGGVAISDDGFGSFGGGLPPG